MAAGRIVNSQFMPARDRSGRLVPGAKMFVYENNSTDLADIFAEYEMTTPRANPVVANSSGVFPDIWADAGTEEDPVLYGYSVTANDGSSIANPSVYYDYRPSVEYGAAGAAQEAAAEAVDAAAEAVAATENKANIDGSNIDSEFADALGIVNVNEEVSITATQTIPNAFPAAYVISDSGSPADYNIFLPSGAAVNSLVFFRVDVTATKLFTLYDSGTDMEGADRSVMHAGESVMLKKLASGWKRVGGIKLPIHGVLRRTSALSLVSGAPTTVTYNTCVGNTRGLTHGFNGTLFEAPRKGTYRFTGNLATTGSAAGQESKARLVSPTVATGGLALSILYGFTGSPRLVHNLGTIITLNRLEQVYIEATVTGTSPGVEYSAGALECTLAFEEIPS